MKIPFEDIIYLDPEFVYAHYESIKKKQVTYSLSKSEGGDAGLKIPSLSAGITTRTTKQYRISCESILSEIIENLRQHTPDTLQWIKGELSIGVWNHIINKVEVDLINQRIKSIEKENFGSEEVIEINRDGHDPLTLLYDSQKFYPGYSSILKASDCSKAFLNFPVEALGKFVIQGVKRDFFIPYLIAFKK